jgi:hypothetical protein
MNRLATDKRTAVIAAVVEGTSINATCRMTGVAKLVSTLDGTPLAEGDLTQVLHGNQITSRLISVSRTDRGQLPRYNYERCATRNAGGSCR